MFHASNNQTCSIRLIVRQQPVKARLCSFKEKVDRRPVDPPPVVQLECQRQEMLHDPSLFLYATLVDTRGDDLHFTNQATPSTAGAVVQSLHKLRDTENKEGGYFIFDDISVRQEGHFKFKFSLFRIVESHVFYLCSILSDTFQVYSPKTFPGMSESTDLTRWFSDQGVRVRIRRNSNTNKRRRTTAQDMMSMQNLLLPPIQKNGCHQPVD
ncbi:developmental regulator [Lichtheimia corymbifera JMRC:FSU:9682]|uniref:Developmental regulator n=1 Tax=Lichtheimia corymbifera JMRC:FSU:9682 TaxID=1263082 RepID=A0A068S9H2_9FUNG|nr:developmental regulator [Lichtheimia corymbifera JMRC:FSU:9682]